STIAAIKAARALLLHNENFESVLIVTSDRESDESYRANADLSGISSDGASAALLTRGCRRNRIGAIEIRNYGEFNEGLFSSADNRLRLSLIRWSATYDAITNAVMRSGTPPDQFVQLVPSNVDMHGWHGVARRLGRPADFVYSRNLSEKAHVCCADG